jgi:hypothetical protein
MGTGLYHKYNILKYRVLHVLYSANEPLTTLAIANKIGIDRKRITDALSHYHRHHYGYTKRLKTKQGHYHLYTITKRGTEAYLSYDKRFRSGKSLNRLKLTSEKVDSVLDYFGINQSGIKKGLNINDIPELAGLKKRNLDTNEDS